MYDQEALLSAVSILRDVVSTSAIISYLTRVFSSCVHHLYCSTECYNHFTIDNPSLVCSSLPLSRAGHVTSIV
jgi:hypothetical protein